VSVKIVAELHPASTKRTTLAADPGTVADIIAKLNTGFPLSHARVCRNGEIVTDFSIRAEGGDTLWIKFVPYGGSTRETGGLMKVGGWALVALGAVIALATGGIGFAATALIGAGISMALGGTVLMNINVPSFKDREKPEQDPSLRGGRNQMRQHGRIPVLFGKHRLYPDLAANPHTEIVDGRQYFIQLFCGGYRDCIIDTDSFKLGDTPLVEFSLSKDIDNIFSGADPYVRLEILQNGATSSLYPYCVHEDALNAELKKNDEDGNPAAIERSTPPNTGAINVDIFFYNGLGAYSNDGDLVWVGVEVKASYKPFDAPDSEYVLLGFFNEASNVITGMELKTKRYQVAKDDLPPGQYTVKVERVTPDSSNSNIIDQVHVGSIRSIKKVRPIRAEVQEDLTVIALRVRAGSQFNGGVLEAFNYIATAKLPVYVGPGTGASYWLATATTRNPAAALLYVLRGRAAQERVADDDIDWPSLEQWFDWCEEHEYTCDAYLSEAMPIADMIRLIGSTARADILRIDSKISVVIDAERPSPVQLFTPKNTKGYSVTMFSADIPDAVSLRFVNEDAGYASDEVQITRAEEAAGEPETIQKVDLWGITNADQARRIGLYKYACLTHRPFVHTVEADIEYLLCNKGDWIQYAGDTALAGTTQGRIAGLIMSEGLCIGIAVDEPIEYRHVDQYAVRIRKANGTVVFKNVMVVPGIPREIVRYPGTNGDLFDPMLGDFVLVDVYAEDPRYEIYFAEPFGAIDAPSLGDIYAFGARGKEVLDLIITDIQPQADLSATLICVEYSPEIFGLDDPEYVLPPFDSKVTPVSGAVDPGTVSPDNWRRFDVFHDNEEEPPRPTGDGQGDGWHATRTWRSIWQSSKTAESIEDGTWGAPVRIGAQRGIDDLTPIYLTLDPQRVQLAFDGNGAVLAGTLPFASQARLFRWNSLITAGVAWSLENAPSGVSVNSNGLVTVAANADLADENNITVRANYGGTQYTALLTVSKDLRSSAPRYLGTVETIPAIATVTIIKGTATGPVLARQGDFVQTITDGPTWNIRHVYQWTGTNWEPRSPALFTDLYLRCFKDGFESLEAWQDMEWFGAVFARQLVVQQAFIEELQAQIITLGNGGQIKSANYNPGDSGFLIEGDSGVAEFNEATIRGTADINFGLLQNIHIRGNASIEGDIDFISGEFKVISDNAKTMLYTGIITADTLREQIALDFDVSISNTYSVTQGNHNLSPSNNEFDTIVFSGVYMSFLKNGNQALPPIRGLGAQGWVFIKMGTTKKIMVYDAPTSTTKTNAVYKTPDGNGDFFLRVKG